MQLLPVTFPATEPAGGSRPWFSHSLLGRICKCHVDGCGHPQSVATQQPGQETAPRCHLLHTHPKIVSGTFPGWIAKREPVEMSLGRTRVKAVPEAGIQPTDILEMDPLAPINGDGDSHPRQDRHLRAELMCESDSAALKSGGVHHVGACLLGFVLCGELLSKFPPRNFSARSNLLPTDPLLFRRLCNTIDGAATLADGAPPLSKGCLSGCQSLLGVVVGVGETSQ